MEQFVVVAPTSTATRYSMLAPGWKIANAGRCSQSSAHVQYRRSQTGEERLCFYRLTAGRKSYNDLLLGQQVGQRPGLRGWTGFATELVPGQAKPIVQRVIAARNRPATLGIRSNTLCGFSGHWCGGRNDLKTGLRKWALACAMCHMGHQRDAAFAGGSGMSAESGILRGGVGLAFPAGWWAR